MAFGVLDAPEDDVVRREVREVPPYVPDANGVDEAWLERFVDWWNGAGTWTALPSETRAGFRSLGWKLAQEILSLIADTTDRATYGTIEAPTLLLGGDRTRPAELRVLHNLAGALPHAKLRIFEGMGHMGPVSHAKLVNEAILDHLATVRRARSAVE